MNTNFNLKPLRLLSTLPKLVAKRAKEGLSRVNGQRTRRNESFHFNWSLKVNRDFQEPFHPTHEAMANLTLDRKLLPEELAANVRKVLSGIVAGNVKETGIQAIRKYGRFLITGEKELMQAMDKLLASFIQQGRMKIDGNYVPCYEISNRI